MLLALLIVLFQFEKTWTYNKIAIGNKTLFSRGLDQLTWLAAREACANMSSIILPSMRDTRALELLHVGEFAWIDGKQYSFCQAKTDDTKTCKYATARRKNSRENLRYICIQGAEYEVKDDHLPYSDAIQQCKNSTNSLLEVNSFALPIVVPLNKTFWVENISESSINSSLKPGQTVTSICIGVIKLDHDNFEFGSTPCDENHTFICDTSGSKTALTLTTNEEMMPSLGDIKARISSKVRPKFDLILISLGPICGVVLVVIAVIVHYRKLKLNQNLPYLHKSRPRGSAVQRRHYGEMLPSDNFMDLRTELERGLLPYKNYNLNYNAQCQSNKSGNITSDLECHTKELSFMSSHNPPDEKNFSHFCNLQEYAILVQQAASCGQSISSGSHKLFPTFKGTSVSKYQAATGKEKEGSNIMYMTDEGENFRKALTPSEYQVTVLYSN